jgi:hypothetical protein
MTFALADESNVLAIRRPLGLNLHSAHESQFLGLLLAIDASQPQFLLRGPQRPHAVWRNLNIFTFFVGATHLAQQPWRCRFIFGIDVQGKDLLPDPLRPALGIGALLSLVQLAAQRASSSSCAEMRSTFSISTTSTM